MTCVLAAIFLTYLYLKKDKDDEHYVTLLLTLGTVLVIGGKIIHGLYTRLVTYLIGAHTDFGKNLLKYFYSLIFF